MRRAGAIPPTIALLAMLFAGATPPSAAAQGEVDAAAARGAADTQVERFRPDPVAYADDDPSAKYVSPPPGSRGQFRLWLDQTLRTHPANAALLMQRSYLLLRLGDTGRARADMERAFKVSATDASQRRRVLWSRGWMRYETGDATGALGDWIDATRLHGGHPDWSTYTLALAYWTLGERDLAFEWYDKAAQSQPELRMLAGTEERFRNWVEPQHAAMLALQAAWHERAAASR